MSHTEKKEKFKKLAELEDLDYDKKSHVNPLSPEIKTHLLVSILFSIHLSVISYETSKEDLSKYQDILSLGITSFVFITLNVSITVRV